VRPLDRELFYFPLRLGRPRPKPPPSDRREDRPAAGYETWREGARRLEIEYEPVDEAGVWRSLLSAPPTPGRVTLVTGEPGAGKSTLLAEWFRRWASDGPALALGSVVPILVRLRDVATDLGTSELTEALGARLWETARSGAGHPWAGFHPLADIRSARIWRPLWLLDGLDELPGDLLDDRLVDRLGVLPGIVVLSCRTAVAQSLGHALVGRVTPGRALEVLPLAPCEQTRFLARCLDGDGSRAAALQRRVASNPQLRELAGCPLLLELIALAGEAALRGNRATFYRDTTVALWERKLGRAAAERLRPHRDPVLIRLAGAMGLKEIVAPIGRLDAALKPIPEAQREAVRDALFAAGLLRSTDERVEFAHLTFQEFFFAQHLATEPFAAVLDRHWAEPRFEETLALLLAQLDAEQRGPELDDTLHAFVAHALDRHRPDAQQLWQLGRSPLRSVLHMLGRAGIDFSRAPLVDLGVRNLLGASSRLRLAVAGDPSVPPQLLVTLAEDDDEHVRRSVAWNATTPSETLARLADDQDMEIRRGVGLNAGTPTDVLCRLTADTEPRVIICVARNPATLPDIIARLSAHHDANVRQSVAQNPATPPDILASLTGELGSEVPARSESHARDVVEPDLLARLAGSRLGYQRIQAAMSPVASSGMLARLAADLNGTVRWWVARHGATPPQTLALLARDPDEGVRVGATLNKATLLEDLLAGW